MATPFDYDDARLGVHTRIGKASGPHWFVREPGAARCGRGLRGGRSGAYAQSALAPAEGAIEIPAGMDPIKFVALWLQGLTAARALRHAGRIATGETVLVEAAGGGVGTMAVQIV